MAPVAFKTVYLFLALVALPHVLAGPACAHRNRGKADCIQKCKNHWGYGGHCMGRDKWGSVISNSKDQGTDTDSVLSTACGLDKTATSEPATIPTDSSYDSSSKPPPPVTSTKSIPAPSELPSDFTPSSTSTSSSTSSTPTTTSTSTSIPPPPPSSPPSVTPSSSDDEAEKPPPTTSSSDKPSTPPAKPSPTPKISSTDGFTEAALTGHNDFRRLHGANDLTWNETLAGDAKRWASGCVFEHSGGKVGPYGENLAAGTGDYTVTKGIKGWTDEVTKYNPNSPVPSHFTQVVWKSTEQLGCAVVTCGPGSIFDKSFGSAQYIVCEYFPPGNIIGRFKENVQV